MPANLLHAIIKAPNWYWRNQREKSKLIGINPSQISIMPWKSDNRRDVLDAIKKENLEAFIEDLSNVCESAGLKC